MKDIKDFLGIIKNYIDDGNSVHLDFYYSDSFSVSDYDIKSFIIDEDTDYLIINDDKMFNLAHCQYPIIKNIEEGVLLSMTLDNATLDLVAHNQTID